MSLLPSFMPAAYCCDDRKHFCNVTTPAETPARMTTLIAAAQRSSTIVNPWHWRGFFIERLATRRLERPVRQDGGYAAAPRPFPARPLNGDCQLDRLLCRQN